MTKNRRGGLGALEPASQKDGEFEVSRLLTGAPNAIAQNRDDR